MKERERVLGEEERRSDEIATDERTKTDGPGASARLIRFIWGGFAVLY